jgi:REP element-mobilizing transposase RayT
MAKKNTQLSFTDHRMTCGRGGPRPGAGRPRGPRPRVAHALRTRVPNGCPVHVTLRVRNDVPALRRNAMVRALRRSFADSCERGSFRLVHYSLQRNHMHLIVEAAGREALACGMKSIAARFARCVNRVFGRRGPVLDGRYHSVLLKTPTQVRNALRYVLLNARKHGLRLRGIDPASSGRWFDGWRGTVLQGDAIGGRQDVAAPRSWLLGVGWRKRGLIGVDEDVG